jgi:hypothetical protein
MPDSGLGDMVETFSAPIEHLIVALGQGIADAQRALDLNSIQTQEALDSDPQTAQLGLQATWYQFPKVDLELKLALSMAQSGSQPSTPAVATPHLNINPALLRASTRLIAQPVSATYQTQFSYDAQAASTLSLSIVPVPAPRPSDSSTNPPRMTPPDVINTALASKAVDAQNKPVKFSTVTGPDGKPAPDPALRFDVNFNGAARLWYVLQYPADLTNATPTVVSVDDATGAVRVISTP